MQPYVNEMSKREAVKYYASIGIITHPLHGPTAEVGSPGKQPKKKGWQTLECPYSDQEIGLAFSEEDNIGFVCGARSDLTVIDMDWHVKGIWDEILHGVDTCNWVKQQHSPCKWHYIFRYFPDVKAKTYQDLGFDILSNTEKKDRKGNPYIAGNNCVAAPSIHPDGSMYKIIGNISERSVIPELVVRRVNDVIRNYEEIKEKVLPKCRKPFRELWTALFTNKKHSLYHNTSIFYGDKDARDRFLHLCTEFKANGASDRNLLLVCRLVFGDRYDEGQSVTELKYIDSELTAKTESIKSDPYLRQFYTSIDSIAIETYNTQKKGKENKDKRDYEKIKIHFDEVGDQILKDYHIFSMRDTGEIYLYDGGVYSSKGAEAILDTRIRKTHNSMFVKKWREVNPGIPLPEHIPKAGKRFVAEALAYIRAFTQTTRERIESDEAMYINLQNCRFNLKTWKTEKHSPEIFTISQFPVIYNPEATCPQISKFFCDIVATPDIDLLCEIAGYCLTTDCSFQKAFMLYGVGSNGKSVLLAMFESLIGSENTSAESLQKLEFDKYRTAKLYGKRVNICGDIPDAKMHKSEVFKRLTSGIDLIDGENKYQNPFVFRNTAKLLFSANILPEGKKDKAYYRRWILINFPNNFEGGTEDRNLLSKLQAPEELSGFLNLALEGLKRLKENGKFSNEKSLEDTQKEYEINSNPIAAFMEECTQASEEDIEGLKLYGFYTQWARANNKRILAYNQWAKEIKNFGYENYRGSTGNKRPTYWCNLSVKFDVLDRLVWKVDEDACPDFIVAEDSENLPSGQAGQAQTLPRLCQARKTYCHSCIFYKVNKEEKGKNDEKSENIPYRGKKPVQPVQTEDVSRTEDAGHAWTGSLTNLPSKPVQEQKTLFFKNSGENYSINNNSEYILLRTDLINFAKSKYKFTVENVPMFVGEFNMEFPGYVNRLGLKAIISNAERLKEWGWK